MFDDLNLLGIFVAATAGFLLGLLWYSKYLFGKTWLKLQLNPIAMLHPRWFYFVGFLLSLFAAAVFSVFLESDTPLWIATLAGLLTGLGWVATSYGFNYLFAGNSWKLFLIDAGYHTVKFTLFGLILGLWR